MRKYTRYPLGILMVTLAVTSLALVLTPGHAQTPPPAPADEVPTRSWKGFDQQIQNSDTITAYLTDLNVPFCKDTPESKYCLAPVLSKSGTGLVFCRKKGTECPKDPRDCGEKDTTIAVMPTKETLFFKPSETSESAKPVVAPPSGQGGP